MLQCKDNSPAATQVDNVEYIQYFIVHSTSQDQENNLPGDKILMLMGFFKVNYF